MSANARRTSLVSALFVVLIVVSVNLLGTRFFERWDLTEHREYTISSSTRRILDNLDDVVSIRVYFSKQLPPYLATLDRQVKDILDEYRARAKGNLSISYVDPSADPATESAVQAMGIPKVQLNIIQRDKAEVTGAYLGIAIQYGDRTEVIPVVQSTGNLEYDLTANIVKVTTERQTVGVAGSAEMNLTQGMEGLQQMLGSQYELVPVTLDSGPVPAEVKTLIVVDSDEVTDRAVYELDAFVMRGGRLIALAPGVEIASGTLSARDRRVRIGGALKAWGADVRSALVADGQSAMASFSQGYMSFTVPYPWWPQVTADGLSRDNVITATMSELVLPWTSPVIPAPVDSSGGAAVTATVLATSSPRSFAATMPYDLSPNSRLRPPPTGLDPQTLAVALSGRFPSLYRNGAPIPGDSLGTAVRPPDLSEPTQIVVVGSARFAEDRFLQQFPSNAVFVANTVDWMTLGNDLIAIRSRGAVTRPLREIEAGERNTLKALAIFGMPLLVIVGGLVRMRVRQMRRRRDAEFYGGTA